MTNNPSLGQRWAAYQVSKTVLVWACAASAVATIAIGFAWGGWVTGGSARDMAASAAEETRAELVAAFCVDRFRTAEDASMQLQALRETQNWNRRSFIEKGGWAAVPGTSLTSDKGATLCAQQLLATEAAAVVPVVR